MSAFPAFPAMVAKSKEEDKPGPSALPPNRLIKANRRTFAAQYNRRQLKVLETRLSRDPEADLTTLFPANYAATLQTRKMLRPVPQLPNGGAPDYDIRARFRATDPCTIIHQLSPEVYRLLSDPEDLAQSLISLLDGSRVIYTFMGSVGVYAVSDTIMLKVTKTIHAETEIGTLLYLQEHLPSFPVPRAHGLVSMGVSALLFTTLIPGLDLEKARPQMGNDEKRDVSNQLDGLLQELRQLPFPSDFQLGGAQQEGCRDGRRDLRVSEDPITTVEEFQAWIFAGAEVASPLYVNFLRKLVPATESKIVFTHGDIRPPNIVVQRAEDGSWKIAAIIDWETSGFYPDYWEAIKMTNNLWPRETHDWYEYLPESVSPAKFAAHWTLDRLLDMSLNNS